jgi:hypothetical protein
MRTGALFVLFAALIAQVAAYVSIARSTRMAPVMAASVAPVKELVESKSPDFYWQYRIDRINGKKGAELAFSKDNYPNAMTLKDQYQAYYLDLTLMGKMNDFDWETEKSITDEEWIGIYENICDWSEKMSEENPTEVDNLPENDFDLLKMFYPQLNYRELENKFSVEEVGDGFPYSNMKEMLNAAANEKLSVPGYSEASGVSLDAKEVRADLAALKEVTMKRVEAVYQESMTFAKNPFPDAEAKTHYAALRSTLADFPQTPADWITFRTNMEKEVDEMARLASKKVDEHHGHGEEEASPAQEFEAKYGRNLDQMQDRFNKFKSDPEGFLEKSILDKYGKTGLDVWKKSQEFSSAMSVMSESEKNAAESAFSDFLKSA